VQLGGGEPGASEEEERRSVVRAYERIKAHEALLSKILLGHLTSDQARAKGVKVVGPEGVEGRAPTISFVVVQEVRKGVWKKKMNSRDIVKVFDDEGKVSPTKGQCGDHQRSRGLSPSTS